MKARRAVNIAAIFTSCAALLLVPTRGSAATRARQFDDCSYYDFDQCYQIDQCDGDYAFDDCENSLSSYAQNYCEPYLWVAEICGASECHGGDKLTCEYRSTVLF